MRASSSVGERRPGGAEDVAHGRRIAPQQRGVEVEAIGVHVRARGGGDVLGDVGRRLLGHDVHDEPDGVAADRAVGAHRGAVREQEVVHDARGA